MPEEFPITPETKVATLLEHYPELEDVLIGLAPPFKKLKNPILRKSVAKVASLRQAAAVGRLSVGDMVNRLREAVGQEALCADVVGGAVSYFGPEPSWFDNERVVDSIDEQEADPNVMPINPLIRRASKMQEGEILELVTTFLPAPGIDLMKSKGYAVWSVEDGPLTKTYFSRLAGPRG